MRYGKTCAFSQSGDSGAGLFEDLVSFFYGNGVRFVAGGGSALKDIIRGDADEREFLEEFPQSLRGLVDAADDGSLVGENGARLLHGFQRPDGKIGKFAGVVEVYHEVKLFVSFLDTLEELE